MTIIAVYGTLRQGQGNHHLIDDTPIAEVQLGGFKMQSLGGFPIVKRSTDEGDAIVAELYRVKPDVLQRCDRLEGHPRWYKREVVGTFGKEKIQMYLMGEDQYPDAPAIESGNWLER